MNRKNKEKTYAQLRTIWGLAHQLNIEPDDLRHLVEEMFPDTQGHLSKLEIKQAGELIELLKKKAGQPIRPYRTGRQPRDENRPYMSMGQNEVAFHIACEIRELQPNKWHTPWHLLDRLAMRDGADGYDRCNTRQAAHVIEALKAMKKRILQKKPTLDKS